jgi:hypothetical protein
MANQDGDRGVRGGLDRGAELVAAHCDLSSEWGQSTRENAAETVLPYSGPGSFSLSSAILQPVLAAMAGRISAVVDGSPAPPSSHPYHP